MSNQLYGYGSSYGGPGLSSRLSGSADSYLSDSSRYHGSDSLLTDQSAEYSALGRNSSSLYANQGDGLRLSAGEIGGVGSYSSGKISGGIGAGSTASMYSHALWGVDGLGGGSMDPSLFPGIKRSTEALYHQTYLGTHNTVGQSEALFSTNSLVKRPRFETASNLPIYPQRPGEKDCAHYMLTRTCKFGDTCKFDHPFWVPEGGIPDWKEVPLVATSESLPERPGEPDCPYFMKTQRCKYGFRCKFNHPKDKTSETADISVLPERPSEPICSFYGKTGKCKFGANCIYHHPKDIQILSSGQDTGSGEKAESAANDDGTASGDSQLVKTFVPTTPALLHNSKGLPIRPGEQDCPFYVKTGSCKYSATCRYNHPDRCATNLAVGVINSAASLLPNIDPRLAQTALGMSPIFYPQRPGQMECDFYMKTGQCKFGERCKFHHPIDRSAPTPLMANQAVQQNVKLTLAGLPRREGSIICPFYMKTGTCKFGALCRYDHPPPGEAIAMTMVQGSGTEATAEAANEGMDTVEPPAQL